MKRRDFLKTTLVTGSGLSAGFNLLAEAPVPPSPKKFVLSAPLTHSDWMLKVGMAWGEEGVRHMLDACKAAGWSKIYWRVFDGGRSCYNSKLLRPMGKWDDDSFWTPQSAEDKAL